MGLFEKVCKHGHVGQYGWQGKRYRCLECRRASTRKSLDKYKTSNPNYKSQMVLANKNHRLKSPEKLLARSKLQYAVKTGKMLRPNYCSACLNEVKVQAHHPDYSEPLNVVWLCKACHERTHHEII